MKKSLLPIVMLVLTFLIPMDRSVQAADQPIYFQFSNVIITEVLNIYKDISGKELIISSNVTHLNAFITLDRDKISDKAQAIKILDEALLKQAHVVMTPLEDGKVSVTYNDALPVYESNVKGNSSITGRSLPSEKPATQELKNN